MNLNENTSHTDEIYDIMSNNPSWILRFGTGLILTLLIITILFSALISYPDVLKVSLKVNSINTPKPLYSKITGKLSELLLEENSKVEIGKPIAFLESTGSHKEVINLLAKLKQLRIKVVESKILDLNLLPPNSNLGELQGIYQNFYQEYRNYLATQNGGYYQRKKLYLQNDLLSIKEIRHQLFIQQKTQREESNNQEKRYDAYRRLIAKNVISKEEFREQQNKFFSSQYPLQQTEASLLTNTMNYSEKEKELLDLDNSIADQKSKFLQVLNSIISDANAWINQYVIISPISGTLGYAGIIQQNQTVTLNQELFIINPGNSSFYGEITIPQYNMGKIFKGQEALVKLHSYPYEQFGIIRGKVSYISDIAFRDSVFIAKVDFLQYENRDNHHHIILKNGMLADAEIIVEKTSLLKRFYMKIFKMVNGN